MKQDENRIDTIDLQTKPQSVNLQIEALGGLAAGVIGTVIGYPLDLVKTRMQTSVASSPTTFTTATSSTASSTCSSSSTKNLFQVGYNVFKHEGVSALYKGMTTPLISLTILNTMTFTSYNYIRMQYNAKRGFDIRNFLAGFTIAPMASTISTVEHLLKTQMQLDNITHQRFTNSFHCLKTLVTEYGSIRILYLGHGVNTLREGVFIGTYFYTYEGMRIQLHHLFTATSTATSINNNNILCENEKAPAWTVPFAGGLSGAWAWFVSFPLDCVKAGVQGQSLSRSQNNNNSYSNNNSNITNTNNGKQHHLKGMGTVLRELLQNKGWRGLYSGVTPSIMRAFIVSSTRFTAYEMVVTLYTKYS